ncbi:Alpha/Beta hydrolase protein [Chaetomium fimeti]|uniref:Alpha/Beta hydrolase protein n=1 Tax=Chaetomium fimeti TaxID=1854472 RepID=A0AAE0H7V7_9PEZI|nr:Alpha/Beta hydrolase protein [Chaetomium fimeti]
MSINWGGIESAGLTGSTQKTGTGGFRAIHLDFRVPLAHNDPKCQETIRLQADLVYGHGGSGTTGYTPDLAGVLSSLTSPLCPSGTAPVAVYLCGGPGSGNPAFAYPELTSTLLDKMETPVLYLDYRGTGGSDPITASKLEGLRPKDAARQLMLYRQDSIVADLEAVRLRLGKVCQKNVKFALVGQSFGGWIAMTYLSFLPGSLAGVWLTGGMPAIGKTPDEVYKALYKRLVRANERYYAKYPQDVGRVREVLHSLAAANRGQGLIADDGQRLTPRGFLTMGRHFGRGEEGFAEVHARVRSLLDPNMVDHGRTDDPDVGGFKLPERPLYAALHEAIYCCGPGVASKWAAQYIGKQQTGGHFAWLDSDFKFERPSSNTPDPSTALYFSGEMIHRFMLREAGPAMQPAFIEPSEILAQCKSWPALYDTVALRRNTVPLRALMYPEDLFVDFDLSRDAANGVRNCEQIYAPSHWAHADIKKRSREHNTIAAMAPTDAPTLLWGGRFTSAIDDLMFQFNESLSFDKVF